MLKLSQKQKDEIEVWEYFMPKNISWNSKNDNDIIKFFEWSEEGKHKDHIDDYSYFSALKQGKRWAGINWQMYEDGVLEGTMPYFTILGGFSNDDNVSHNPIPRSVVNQMKKEMFQGHDAHLIEECYQELCVNV